MKIRLTRSQRIERRLQRKLRGAGGNLDLSGIEDARLAAIKEIDEEIRVEKAKRER